MRSSRQSRSAVKPADDVTRLIQDLLLDFTVPCPCCEGTGDGPIFYCNACAGTGRRDKEYESQTQCSRDGVCNVPCS